MGALAMYSSYLDAEPENDFELGLKTQEGLALESVEELKRVGFTATEIGEVVIPLRTLKHRKAKGQRLSPDESDRLLRVVRVLAFADRVFGNHEKAMRWLRYTSSRLDDTTPINALKTAAGARFVEGMLWSISENMFQ